MTGIVELKADRAELISDTLVKTLERLLEEAKGGHINGIAYVTCRALGVGHCRGYGRGWSGDGVSYVFDGMHGELTMLQYEMCAIRAHDAREGDEVDIDH